MDEPSTSLLTPVIGLIIGIYIIYTLIVYPLLLHPLRKIPSAHWSVPFPGVGHFWILHRRYIYSNNRSTYAAHVKYGSVVRLGYNEISVDCVDNGIRTIYGGGWEKHEWYARQFPSYNVINMFSTVHHTPHSQKKRTMANIYSKSNLQVSSQLKANSKLLLTDRFLPLLKRLGETGEATDVHEMNNAFTMDFMSAYLFGIGRSTNFTQDISARKEMLHLYHCRRDYEWHSAEVPPALRRIIDRLPIPFVPSIVGTANQWLGEWNANMCKSAEKYLAQHTLPDPSNPGDEPVVFKHFKTGIAKLRQKDPEAGREFLPHIIDPTPFIKLNDGFETMSKEELKSEMSDHLGAGHETSAIALTYLYWELSRNRKLQEALCNEVKTLEPSLQWPLRVPVADYDLPDPKKIDSLPYLHAVIMETLRLHSPIPGIEPRVSPYVQGGSTLGPYSGIPGGVRVSSMPYALHRNASVFPDPESFDPDRWLTEDEDKLKEMNRWFWAFGSGGRMCIGSHLAVQEMKLIVAALFTNWTTDIVDDEGIEELDTYTTRPLSNRLMLKFSHR